MVILVDKEDQVVGTAHKMTVHELGLLHRAFSVLVFNSKGELLLQQRALHKYHTPGLWTNTCCSHPFPEEETNQAACRRLKEEMGLEIPLENLFTFRYFSELPDGLIEHEMDHVLVGYTNEEPVINPEEVAGFRYMSMETILSELIRQPELYTPWFKIIIMQFGNKIEAVRRGRR